MRRAALLLIAAFLSTPSSAHAQGEDIRRAISHVRAAFTPPHIREGAIELGVGASLTTVESSTRSTFVLRAGSFKQGGPSLVGAELEAGYSHRTSLDVLDLGLNLSLLRPVGTGSVYPFIAVGGGWRQEWIGSFRQSRYPVGADAGVRFLSGRGALFRVEYRFRRVLNDPVSDFNEHHVLSGVSLLLRNPA